mgnify:CR=1 FL=1
MFNNDTTNKEVLYPDGKDYNYESQYNKKTFYGRTNRLRFKLCHRFCGSCSVIGIDDNKQKCLSCLPEYQYDYFNLSRSNCVPEGYYYDIEINKLIKCDIENFIY